MIFCIKNDYLRTYSAGHPEGTVESEMEKLKDSAK